MAVGAVLQEKYGLKLLRPDEILLESRHHQSEHLTDRPIQRKKGCNQQQQQIQRRSVVFRPLRPTYQVDMFQRNSLSVLDVFPTHCQCRLPHLPAQDLPPGWGSGMVASRPPFCFNSTNAFVQRIPAFAPVWAVISWGVLTGTLMERAGRRPPTDCGRFIPYALLHP